MMPSLVKKIFIISLCCVSYISSASLQIATTRVIMTDSQKDVGVRVNNVGNSPSLTKVWISDQETKGLEGSNDVVPFFISPPVTQINVGKGKVFRIFALDSAKSALPQDRESVYWLNVLDIPALDEDSKSKNGISMALRTIIKIFFRPSGLKGTLSNAAEGLTFSATPEGRHTHITVVNNYGYYISLNKLVLKNSNGEKETPSRMLEPFSTSEFVFENVSADAGSSIVYRYITEQGAYITLTKALM